MKDGNFYMNDSSEPKKAKDAKFGKVMGEYKAGTLKSSSGQKVTNPKQAKAIAISEIMRDREK